MTDDYELLAGWRAGDVEAGNALFRRHFDPLLRFFYGKVGDDAEDLVQTTLLRCVEARDRFREECTFRTFLFAVARKSLLRYYQAKATARRFDPAVSSLHDLATSPSGLVARAEDRTLLLHALQRVPLDFQLALELHYWEGLPAKDLAIVLDIDPTTARTRLFRGRQILRKRLEDLETDPARCQSILAKFLHGSPDQQQSAPQVSIVTSGELSD